MLSSAHIGDAHEIGGKRSRPRDDRVARTYAAHLALALRLELRTIGLMELFRGRGKEAFAACARGGSKFITAYLCYVIRWTSCLQ